jgi:hypothetical protein
MNGSGKRPNTRASSNTSGLAYHTNELLDEVISGVSKICSVNEGTQEKVAALMEHLDKAPTQVGLILCVRSYLQ